MTTSNEEIDGLTAAFRVRDRRCGTPLGGCLRRGFARFEPGLDGSPGRGAAVDERFGDLCTSPRAPSMLSHQGCRAHSFMRSKRT